MYVFVYIHTHTHMCAVFAGNRNLLLNKGFGAFTTAVDEKKQREREEEVARELKENKEQVLHKRECACICLRMYVLSMYVRAHAYN